MGDKKVNKIKKGNKFGLKNIFLCISILIIIVIVTFALVKRNENKNCSVVTQDIFNFTDNIKLIPSECSENYKVSYKEDNKNIITLSYNSRKNNYDIRLKTKNSDKMQLLDSGKYEGLKKDKDNNIIVPFDIYNLTENNKHYIRIDVLNDYKIDNVYNKYFIDEDGNLDIKMNYYGDKHVKIEYGKHKVNIKDNLLINNDFRNYYSKKTYIEENKNIENNIIPKVYIENNKVNILNIYGEEYILNLENEVPKYIDYSNNNDGGYFYILTNKGNIYKFNNLFNYKKNEILNKNDNKYYSGGNANDMLIIYSDAFNLIGNTEIVIPVSNNNLLLDDNMFATHVLTYQNNTENIDSYGYGFSINYDSSISDKLYCYGFCDNNFDVKYNFNNYYKIDNNKLLISFIFKENGKLFLIDNNGYMYNIKDQDKFINLKNPTKFELVRVNDKKVNNVIYEGYEFRNNFTIDKNNDKNTIIEHYNLNQGNIILNINYEDGTHNKFKDNIEIIEYMY